MKERLFKSIAKEGIKIVIPAALGFAGATAYFEYQKEPTPQMLDDVKIQRQFADIYDRQQLLAQSLGRVNVVLSDHGKRISYLMEGPKPK